MKEKAFTRLEAPSTKLRRFRAPDSLMLQLYEEICILPCLHVTLGP